MSKTAITVAKIFIQNSVKQTRKHATTEAQPRRFDLQVILLVIIKANDAVLTQIS